MTSKSKKILTEISAGELLDKMTILEIKLDKIRDKENLLEVSKEYESLKETKKSNIKLTKDLENLIIQLKEINLKLWDFEDKSRICEKIVRLDSSVLRSWYRINCVGTELISGWSLWDSHRVFA